MVNILTDSCSDLSPELIKKFNLHVIPLSVVVKDRLFHDGIDITPADLFQSVQDTGELPKTSAPSLAEFTAFYQSIPGDLVYIGIGSKLSATVQNAAVAARNLPDRKIFVVDSNNLSTGIGLLALKAAELRDEGLRAEEIAKEITQAAEKIHTSFVVETLDYLYLGGRCSALQNIAGSLLKIRPIIETKPNGTLGVKEKIRGTRKRALDSMLEDFKKNSALIDLKRVFITHTGCDDDATYLKSHLYQSAPIQEIWTTLAGATISSHCGPNTIGVIYVLR
ncbi:MAG: DegV family protein [Anaerolineae bacterium]|nr:DegV family protein [Anaerolineae bacterium]